MTAREALTKAIEQIDDNGAEAMRTLLDIRDELPSDAPCPWTADQIEAEMSALTTQWPQLAMEQHGAIGMLRYLAARVRQEEG